MNKKRILEALEQAVIAMRAYAYKEDAEQPSESTDEPDDTAIKEAIDEFLRTSLVIRPAGERCPHCNGTGRKKK